MVFTRNALDAKDGTPGSLKMLDVPEVTEGFALAQGELDVIPNSLVNSPMVLVELTAPFPKENFRGHI